MALGKKTGGRRKGSLNKATADIREAALEFSDRALQVIVDVMETGDNVTARLAAASAILDRAYGKPKQQTEGDLNIKGALTILTGVPRANGS